MDKKYTRNRLKEIISVALKHGIKKEIKDPKTLRLVLEDLGPSFIKIGQILSTRPDILPIEYIKELEGLQDDVRIEGFNIMKDIIEKELGDGIDRIFIDFNKEPIASASISEIYLARLYNKDRVIIKVQKPNIKEKMIADINILKKLAPFINLTTSGEIVDMEEVLEELELAIRNELDFTKEMNNIIRFTKNNKDIGFIKDIKTYKEYSSEKLLVMEYIPGIKINKIEELKRENYDMEDLAKKLTNNYLKQILEDGFFHGDPHPGNILIHENTIAYIDFGLMGELNQSLKERFNRILEAAATGNIDLMAETIRKIGRKKGKVDMYNLYKDVEYMYSNYIDLSIYDYDISEILEEMMVIAKNNNIQMPKDLVILAKGLMIFQGVISKIDKNLSIIDIALPYFKNRILKRQLKGIDYWKIGLDLYKSTKSTINLSTKSIDLIDNILKGRMKLNLELRNMEEAFNEINRMVNRLIFAIVIAGLLISSSLVVGSRIGLEIYGISAIGVLGYLGAGLAGVLLLVSIYKSGKL